ncbi:hypothetical protein BDE36_1775 [Arcticibacter tournemirensis]|uniref:RtcB family protein n=1 Tax=Arcticibacter tournemirensis TaxID=699437 RepID=A0A5M9HBK2_9SPHI|nr:RtcB family protein [Arcticibacter tournemirensis]KAA8483759.1 RtcB family protein [Arcticibacter tournemirensis]TQM50040.1 hypothetical protein BDE36_1775 [Arcticibacter tournemirensis]
MSEQISPDLMMMGEHGIIVSALTYDPITQPVSPKPEKTDSGDDIAYWGDNNDDPQEIIKRVKADTELPPLLDWKGRVLQGREVIAVNLVYNEEKKDFDTERINDPEINDFLHHRSFKRYWREAAVDFVWFANVFPDMIKSNGLDKIAYLGVHSADWCRWNKQDKTGTTTKCYVSPSWPDAKPTDENCNTFDVVDPYNPMLLEKVKEKKSLKRFVYPISYPMPGNAYYQMAPWHPFVFSKWYEIKRLIERMKESLLKKILSAKWILTIPVNYWPAAYKDWEKKSPEERLEIKKKKVAEIEKSITGVDNTGKLILTEAGLDQNNKEIQGWKLERISDNIKDGEHLEDSHEASQHGMRALGTDPTLVGDGPGKTGAGGGSGSDKRIAFNIFVAILQPYREVLLEPLYFVAEFNGWTSRFPNLRFKILEVELETLDKGTTSKVTNPVTKSEGNGAN